MKKSRAATMTHDYKRHGTTTLFAALDVATGAVVHECMPRHRHQEFLRFLRQIDGAVAPELDIHVILDESARAFGAGAAGHLRGFEWSAFAESHSLDAKQRIQVNPESDRDRWTADGARIGAAAVRPLDAGHLACNAERVTLSGHAERADLTGAIYRASEQVIAVAAQAALRPAARPWSAALRVSVAREYAESRDAIAEIGSRIESWTPGLALEVARELGDALALSLGYAGSLYQPDAAVPSSAAQGEVYRRVIAPDLALAATPAAAHPATLRFRWAPGRDRALTGGFRYHTAFDRNPATALAPHGSRTGWSFDLGAVLRGN